jgi:hypothetical protein
VRRPHIFASALASLAVVAGLFMAVPAYADASQTGSAQQVERQLVINQR